MSTISPYTAPLAGTTPRYHANKVEPLDGKRRPRVEPPRGSIEDVIAAHHPKFHQDLRRIANTTFDANGQPLSAKTGLSMVDYMLYMAKGFNRSLAMEPEDEVKGRAYEEALKKQQEVQARLDVAQAQAHGDGNFEAVRAAEKALADATTELGKSPTTNHGPLVEFNMSGMQDAYCVGTLFNAIATQYPEIAHAMQAASVDKGLTTANAQSVRAELRDYQKPVDMAALYTIGKELNLLSPEMGFDALKKGSILGFTRSPEEIQRRAGTHGVMVTDKGTDEAGRQFVEVTSGNNQFGATPGENVGGGGHISYRIYRDQLTDGVVREPDGNKRYVGWHMDPDRMQAYHEQYMQERGLDPKDRATPMNSCEVLNALGVNVGDLRSIKPCEPSAPKLQRADLQPAPTTGPDAPPRNVAAAPQEDTSRQVS